jgi:hypothetical protein
MTVFRALVSGLMRIIPESEASRWSTTSHFVVLLA